MYQSVAPIGINIQYTQKTVVMYDLFCEKNSGLVNFGMAWQVQRTIGVRVLYTLYILAGLPTSAPALLSISLCPFQFCLAIHSVCVVQFCGSTFFNTPYCSFFFFFFLLPLIFRLWIVASDALVIHS